MAALPHSDKAAEIQNCATGYPSNNLKDSWVGCKIITGRNQGEDYCEKAYQRTGGKPKRVEKGKGLSLFEAAEKIKSKKPAEEYGYEYSCGKTYLVYTVTKVTKAKPETGEAEKVTYSEERIIMDNYMLGMNCDFAAKEGRTTAQKKSICFMDVPDTRVGKERDRYFKFEKTCEDLGRDTLTPHAGLYYVVPGDKEDVQRRMNYCECEVRDKRGLCRANGIGAARLEYQDMFDQDFEQQSLAIPGHYNNYGYGQSPRYSINNGYDQYDAVSMTMMISIGLILFALVCLTCFVVNVCVGVVGYMVGVRSYRRVKNEENASNVV